MAHDDVLRTNEPSDRLTRLCAAMVATLEAEPGTESVRAIVMLHDDGRGGIMTHGYAADADHDAEAVADLLIYLRTMFRANGSDLVVMPLGSVN